MMKLACGLEGRYNLRVLDAETLEVKRETGWFKNLITAIGLNRIGLGGPGTHAFVGSGSNTPNVNDTGMQSFVAATNAKTGSVSGAQSTEPYFGWHRVTFRFPVGTAAGNLSEVGVGWYSGSTHQSFSRARILDPEGDPTTITVLSDEVLDVVYELRLYPPADDVVGEVVIGGETYDFVVRPVGVTTVDGWGLNSLLEYGIHPPGVPYQMVPFSGTIGTVTGGPTGTQGTASSNTVKAAYSNNSLKVQYTMHWDLAGANIGGVGAVMMFPQAKSLGAFQISFDPVIPKDNTKIMSLTFEFTWARKT